MRTIVYVDGQNFLYKAADVLISAGKIADKQELHTIAIRKLFEGLLQEEGIEIRYYGTKLKKYKAPPYPQEIADKSRTFVDSQRRLKNSLVKQEIAFVESGRLKLRDGDKCKNCEAQDLHFQEKGVDVKVAVDLILDSGLQDVGKMILVSSDNDLLPAVLSVVERGKHIVYVGFSDYLTKALVANASEVQVIRNAELIGAFDDANPAQLALLSTEAGS